MVGWGGDVRQNQTSAETWILATGLCSLLCYLTGTGTMQSLRLDGGQKEIIVQILFLTVMDKSLLVRVFLSLQAEDEL